jgi:RNA polymerase sporulation-specific sigma factor
VLFLDEISDDWLISLYREGNQIAIDLLLERYNVFLYGFIHRILKQECAKYDYRELFQELFIIFINCIERYDEDGGCFYYFVKCSAERKIFDFLNKSKRISKIASLDDCYYDDGVERYVDYIQENNSEEYYETELYGSLKEKLNEEEMKIIDMKVEGYTYQEIASSLGVSKQGVYRRVVYIKNIIKDIIEKID